MNRYLIIFGLAIALGACSSPSKTTTEEPEAMEEPTIEAVIDTVEAVVDSMAVEMDSVMIEAVDSVTAE